MATYYFCSGFTQQSVNVTAVFGSCSDYRAYNDGTCLYQTFSMPITFTVSSANHPALNVRFRYWQDYYNNNVLVWSGYITASVTIPAGVTNTTYEALVGFPFDCHEHRYCNFGGGNNNNQPQQQMQIQ